MQGHLMVIVGVLTWHLAMLSSLSLITGRFSEPGFVAPWAVIRSRSHLMGAFLAVIGALLIILSEMSGLLDYGIFVGVALMLADSFLAHRAFKRRSGRTT
jgi:drug/metabolite transporter (DMT)-like permease